MNGLRPNREPHEILGALLRLMGVALILHSAFQMTTYHDFFVEDWLRSYTIRFNWGSSLGPPYTNYLFRGGSIETFCIMLKSCSALTGLGIALVTFGGQIARRCYLPRTAQKVSG